MITWNDLDEILFSGAVHYPDISVCEHFSGNEKTMNKAMDLQIEKGPIFDITFDLEDGAKVGQETQHRDLVCSLLVSEKNVFNRIGVRVHDPESRYTEDDLTEIIRNAGNKLAYITIPKCRNSGEIRRIQDTVRHLCQKYDVSQRIPLHVLIESQSALKDADSIAVLEDVETLDFGLMDFVSDYQGAVPIKAMKSPDQFTHPLIRSAREQLAQAALSNGKIASQNVCIDLKNAEVIESDASIARNQFGFLRMWSIHPAQIEPILRGMAPSPEEIHSAENILKKAMIESMGPVEYNGLLHDRASYRSYWNLLKRARFSGIWVI
jgi:citrate lyase subunit beta/citryl-CoA lyase